MTERPIIFSGPMVRAILEGRKTQTRRVMRPQPDGDGKVTVARGVAYIGNSTDGGAVTRVPCPYGRPGDRLRVRVPRTASRLILEVTGIRVERLQDISEADALAEGIRYVGNGTLVSAFRVLWSTTNRRFPWHANPWVWVLEFRMVPEEVVGL